MRQLSLHYAATDGKRGGQAGKRRGQAAKGRARPGGRPRSRSAKLRRFALRRWRSLLGVSICLGLGGWLAPPGHVADLGEQARSLFLSVTADQGMTVQRVLSAGRREVPVTAILDALDAEIGTPIFAVDTDEARRRLEGLPWVARARVERRLPSTIFVNLIERRPFALWQREGNLVVVGREGAVLDAQAISRHAHLPIIVGPGAPLAAPALLDAMAADPTLLSRLSAAVWVSERRWNLRFDTGLEARLPEGDTDAALERLAAVIHERRLLDRPAALVDIRLKDRTIVRLKPPAPPRAEET